MKRGQLDKIIMGLLLAAVVFTAWARGATEAWSIAVFEAVILAALVLWILKLAVEKKVDLIVPASFWPIAAFLCYGVIQTVGWADAAGNPASLSMDREATKRLLPLLLFIIAAHIVAANVLKDTARVGFFAKFLTAFGFILALASLIQYFAGDDIGIFWFGKPVVLSQWLHGPFLNHNHFSGYMELIIPIPFAFAFIGVRETRAIYGFAAVIMTIAAMFTVSRGGMVSIAASVLFVIVFASLFSLRYRNRFIDIDPDASYIGAIAGRHWVRNLVATILILGSIVAGVAWLGVEPILNRLPDAGLAGLGDNQETFESSRGWIWKNTIVIFQDNSLYGTGMGTFENILPKYANSSAPDSTGKLFVWNKAHNDYLQILAETGLIGGTLALWFLVTIFIAIWRSLFLRDRFKATLAIGCNSAIFALLVHSVFDYNLQIPSTALLFLILTAVSANLTSSRKTG
ncbi:O-antigen ligase [soil metagenome]